MRSKKWLKLLAVVMCIALLLTVMVACINPDVDDDDDNNDIDNGETADVTTIVTQMIDKLVGSYAVDDAKYFSVDVAASVQLDTKGEGAKKLWRYEVIAKANVNLVNGASDDKTSMLFEINSYYTDENNAEQKTTLFSIFYENEVDNDGTLTGSYFYLIFADEAPIKVNAFSMYKIVKLISPDAVPEISAAADIDISTIIPIVISMLVNTAEVVDNDYVLTMDLINVWTSLSMLITPLISDPSALASMLNIDEQTINDIFATVDGAIAEIFGELTYKTNAKDDPETDIDESATMIDKNVTSLVDLVYYIDQNVPNILVTAKVNFDAKDKFENADLIATYQPHNNNGVYDAPTHEFKAAVTKAYVGTHANVEVDAGYPLTKEQRVAITDVANIFNFAIDGTIEMTKNGAVDILTYSIDADINPFVLFDGLTLDSIKKLGYVNLTVNGSDGVNLLTVHSNFADGCLYLNMKGYGSSFMIKNFNIGGRLDFDALMDTITILGGGKVEVNSVADVSSEDNLIIDILKIVFNSINLDNIAEDGVVIDVSKANVDKIFSYIDLGDSAANTAAPIIVATMLFGDSQTMAIKVNQDGFVYGGCEKIEVSQIDFSAFDANDIIGVQEPEIYNSIKKQYEYGEAFTNGITWSPEDGDDANTFKIKGIDASGKTNYNLKGVYMGSTYDPYKIGKQKVRVYFGSNNLFNTMSGVSSSFIKKLIADSPMIPINGVQYVEYEVEVLDKIDNSTAFVDVQGTNQLGVGENIADKLNATLYYENGRSIKVTQSMISCNKSVIDKNGNIKFAGEWIIDINYYTAHATVKIVVGELVYNEFSSLTLGKDDLKTALDLKIKTVNSSGIYEYSPCEITIKVLKINNIVVDPAEAFVQGSMKFKPDHAWHDKSVSIVVTYNLFGELKERTISFKLKVEEGSDIIKKGSSDFNYNAAAENLAKITTSDLDADNKAITYTISYDGSNYVGKYVLTKDKQDIVYTYKGNITAEINYVTKNENGEVTKRTPIEYANGNCLRTPGSYEGIITVGDSFITISFKVKNAVVLAGSKGEVSYNNDFYASSGIFSLNLNANGIIADAKANTAITLVWDSKTLKYSLNYKTSDDKTKAVSADDIELSVVFSKDGNLVDPIASSTSKITFAEAGTYTAVVSLNIKSISLELSETLTIKLKK